MFKIFKILFLVLVASVVYFKLNSNIDLRSLVYYSVCDKPIYYSIGFIDERYKLTKDSFLDNVAKAAGIWNDGYKKEIFIYKEDGDLDIHFIYDKKQELNEEISSLSDDLIEGKSSLDIKISSYENKVKIYKQKIDDYNKKIEQLNNTGATQEQVDEINTLGNILRNEGEILNKEAQDLNLQTNNYNSQVYSYNSSIDNFNKELDARPEEGVYFSKEHKIEIYFVPSKNELVHTLAHEFGHSLGIEHENKNPNSIMYPFTSERIKLSQNDKELLENVCAPKPVWSDLKLKLEYFLDNYSSFFLK